MRKQLLERRVIKQIPLSNGNLIMDVPVPKEVIPSTKGLGIDTDEMDKLRYSAATCDPDEFMARKFTLRQYLNGRKTELFVSVICIQRKVTETSQIVMTMYNETSDLLLRTLNSVIKNIAHLCSRTRSKTWGPDSWKKVVVCIVADGRKVVDPRVLKVLQLMGVYAEVSNVTRLEEGVVMMAGCGEGYRRGKGGTGTRLRVSLSTMRVKFVVHASGTHRRSSCPMQGRSDSDQCRSSCSSVSRSRCVFFARSLCLVPLTRITEQKETQLTPVVLQVSVLAVNRARLIGVAPSDLSSDPM
jgi:hypothetical protein